MRTLLALSLLSLLCASAPTSAQSRAGYFGSADGDHDGRLSLAEFQDWMSYAFRRMDGNRDNVLDPGEQHVPNATRLTLEELHARQAEQFRRQDKNRDGFLSEQEFLAPPG